MLICSNEDEEALLSKDDDTCAKMQRIASQAEIITESAVTTARSNVSARLLHQMYLGY